MAPMKRQGVVDVTDSPATEPSVASGGSAAKRRKTTERKFDAPPVSPKSSVRAFLKLNPALATGRKGEESASECGSTSAPSTTAPSTVETGAKLGSIASSSAAEGLPSLASTSENGDGMDGVPCTEAELLEGLMGPAPSQPIPLSVLRLPPSWAQRPPGGQAQVPELAVSEIGSGQADEDAVSEAPTLTLGDGRPEGPTELQSISGIVKAVDDNIAKQVAEKYLGTRLTAENLKKLEATFGELDKTLQRPANEIIETRNLSAADLKKKEQIERMIANGGLEGANTRSTLGNNFRAEHGADPEYLALDKDERKKFRDDWLATKHSNFTTKSVHKKSWSRKDLTKAKFWTLTKIIIEEGGFDDEEAVAGAIRLALQCLAMGPPWIMRHPQTQRLLFALLQFKWCEEMQQV